MGQSLCCGLQSPNPLPPKPREKSLIKVPLAELQDHTKPHYFVLPWSHQYFRQNFLQRITQSFPNITIFSNRAELAAFEEDGKINILIITCDSSDSIDQLKLSQLPSLHAFSQIVVALKEGLTEGSIKKQDCQKEMGFRFVRIIKESQDEMISFMNEAKLGRAVYFCHKDRGHINQINIIFDYLFRNGEESSGLAHFFQWARSLPEDQGFIDMLQTMANQKLRGQHIAHNMCAYNKTCMQIVEMLKRIRNPCVLAHIAWFCSTLYKFIHTSYSTFLNEPQESRKNQFVAWVGLTKEDIKAMKVDQNFMFSTFVIGSSNLDYRRPTDQQADHPNLTYYMFIINLRGDLNQNDSLVDLGLFQHAQMVIFNLQNMYRLESCNHELKFAQVTYCSVGPQFTKKKKNPRYSTWPHPPLSNIHMMDTYDVYHLYRRNIKCQLDLILALQFYHSYKRIVLTQLQTLPRTNKTAQTAATGNILVQTATTIDERHHPSSSLLDKIGDSYLSTFDFAAAEEAYRQLQRRQVRLAKLLYLHLTNVNGRNSRRSFRLTMEELEQNPPQINETIAELNRHMMANENPDKTKELELKRRVVKAGYVSYVVDFFRAVLLGYTDYRSARSASITNSAKIANYYSVKYVENVQSTSKMPSANIYHHSESFSYFSLGYMAMKTNLDLEIMNGSVGIQTMRKDLQEVRRKTDGLHFFFLPEHD